MNDGGDLSVPDASSERDAEGGSPTCNGSPLRVFDETPGVAQRYYVDLPFQGGAAPFLVDTGSGGSFLRTSADTNDAGATSISCVPVTLPGYSGSASEHTPDGDLVQGILGADLVSRGAALDLQIADQRLFWWRTPPAPPAGATVIPLAFNTSFVALVASGIELDGKKVRLVLDTGSPHILILSPTPRPNETVIQTTDGNGNPVSLYTSTISVAFAGNPPQTVAVDRADKFPSLEKLVGELGGGDIVGLLGIGALGHKRVVISSTSLAFVP